MSLLLEALRKADRDREQSQAPVGISAHHGPTQSGHGGRWLVVVLLAALALLAGVIVWLLVQASSPSESVDTDSVLTTPLGHTKPEVMPPKAILPAAEIEQSKVSPATKAPPKLGGDATTAPARGDVEPQPQAQVTSAGTLSMVGEAYAEQAPAVPAVDDRDGVKSIDESSNASVLDASDAEVMALYQQPQREQATQAQESRQNTQRPAAQVAVAAKPAVADTAASEFDQLGGVRSLPLAVQNAVPTLMYSLHNYDASGGNSSVIINGRIWQEGQQVAAGITLESIEAQGAIFSLGDHRFKLKAQSSWVNM